MDVIDIGLLVLILLFYGVGDVVTTLHGMKHHDMDEGNRFHNWMFGDKMRWYQSIGAKIVTLSLVLVVYFIARIQHTSYTYQITWWVIALLIIGQGIRVTYLNWQDIKRVQ